MKRGQPIGWARVLSGAESCPFCVMLASRGAVYQSKKTAAAFKHETKQGHNACDCRIVPVWDKNHWEGKEQADALYEKWLEVANREEHPDQWGAWRRWYENQAAEGQRLIAIAKQDAQARSEPARNAGARHEADRKRTTQDTVNAEKSEAAKASDKKLQEPNGEEFGRERRNPAAAGELTLEPAQENQNAEIKRATREFAHTKHEGLDEAIADTVFEWTDDGYKEVNAHLRRDEPLTPAAKRIIDGLGEFFETKTLSESIRVVRRERDIKWTGALDGQWEDLLETEHVLHGFTSTTYPGNNVGEAFGDFVWVIDVPAGTRCAPIADISKYPEEGEILLDRGATIRVTQVDVDGDSVMIHAVVLNGGNDGKP